MLGGVDGDLLPIGQFARLGRLSVKQLRHYDELGLLVPAWVDPVTGYRYYRASQARVALSIGLLRSLDVPLPVVGRVLEGDAGALEDVRAGLEAELARRRRTLASLERVMAGGLPAPEVSVARLPARRVLVAREVAGGPEGIGRATSAAVARVLAVSAGEGEVRLTGGCSRWIWTGWWRCWWRGRCRAGRGAAARRRRPARGGAGGGAGGRGVRGCPACGPVRPDPADGECGAGVVRGAAAGGAGGA
ncbi:helix-turn-helix domain-containing protein [Nonomuraea ferruginea]